MRWLADAPDGRVSVTGGTASDVSAGVGAFLMEYANLTFGWPRGGGQNVFTPQPWPKVGAPLKRTRSAPWSYIMNVCTHSYSLVWYSWEEWEAFIDWQALLGINLNLAMTGQEGEPPPPPGFATAESLGAIPYGTRGHIVTACQPT